MGEENDYLYYQALDTDDSAFIESLKPGDLDKNEDILSQPRSSSDAAADDRFLLGLLKKPRPRPPLYGGGLPGNGLHVIHTCRQDTDCPAPQKCCLVQVAKYVYRDACRFPASPYDSYLY